MNIDRIINDLGPICYHLHVEASTSDPKDYHKRMNERFRKTTQLRYLRRSNLAYVRLLNIEDRCSDYRRLHFRYIIDYLSPSLALLAELCNESRGRAEISAPKLKLPQILKCFPFPVNVECTGPGTFRFLTSLHPLEIINPLLLAYPKSIDFINFGLAHTLWFTPSIDESDHWRRDPMTFPYKRITKFQPIHFNYNHENKK